MRTGQRVALICVLLSAALCSTAHAADTLNVYVDNPSIALGSVTTFAAHAETDADFHGGHVVFKYRGADSDCAATPDADPGADATDQPVTVGAGPGASDVGGQQLQLDVGNWVICGWLVDDTTGAVVAQGSAIVQVIPYAGSISISVRKSTSSVQLTFAYTTSEPAQFYATVQQRACPRFVSRIPKGALLVTPRGGRFVGSDGGLGKTVPMGQLTPGRWNVCAWLVAPDGRVGPTVKTFSVPRAKKPRRAVRVAG